MSSYTFICLNDNQVATFVDPQPIDADAIRAHAFGLLREHASAVVVEVWGDEQLVARIARIARIARDGIRPRPGAQGGDVDAQA